MRNDFEPNYLAHHGILGMKWGVKNGPPYPLGASDHSKSEKKAGWRKSLKGSYEKAMQKKADRRQLEADKYAEKHGKRSRILDAKASTAKEEVNKVSSVKVKKVTDKNITENKNHLTDEQKRMIRNGAIAAGAALAILGGMYIYKKAKLNPVHMSMSRYGTILNPKDFSSDALVISKTKKIQRISTKSVEDYINDGKRIYASYLKKDNAIYKEQMPQYIKMWNKQGLVESNKAYVHSLKLKRDIKIASPKDVLEAYAKANGVDEVDHGHFSSFAIGLIDKKSDVNTKFFDEIKARGFDGIIDPNDSDYITGRVFGSYTNQPLILIDPGSIIESSKSKKLTGIGRFINVITS